MPHEQRVLTRDASVSFKGPGALAFLSHLLPASLATLPIPGEDAHRPFGSTLSVLLNEQGGILDDCMITRWGEDRYGANGSA
jgi:aminomethyltransferase